MLNEGKQQLTLSSRQTILYFIYWKLHSIKQSVKIIRHLNLTDESQTQTYSLCSMQSRLNIRLRNGGDYSELE